MNPKYLINWIISLSIIAVLVYVFAPGLWTKGRIFYKDQLGWTEEARKSDPVGFLKFTKGNLTKALTKIESNANDLKVQLVRIEKELATQKENQGKYQELLNRASDIYKKAEENTNSGYPVEFAGDTYKKNDFVVQMKLLFDRNNLSLKQIEQLKISNDRILSILAQINIKKAKVEGALSGIDTTIVVAEASATSSDIQDAIQNIANVQEEVNIYLGQDDVKITPIRDPAKMISQENVEPTDSDFKMFLNNSK